MQQTSLFPRRKSSEYIRFHRLPDAQQPDLHAMHRLVGGLRCQLRTSGVQISAISICRQSATLLNDRCPQRYTSNDAEPAQSTDEQLAAINAAPCIRLTVL